MKRIIALCLALMTLLCAAANAEGGLKIVAASFTCYDFARAAVGEDGQVALLIKPGVEVHAYEPSPADIVAIEEADLFVYVGGEGDAWAEDILSGFDGSGPRVVRLMDAVAPLEEEGGEDHDHDAPEYDEHIWTSPVNAAAMVAALRDALTGLDGADEAAFAGRAEDYIAQIDAIDADIRALVDSAARHKLVFADRFPFLYFVREYGLDYVAAFPSCTADTEPTPQTLLTLIRTVQEENIPVVYTIEMSSGAVARTVSEETGAAVRTLHSMQTVTQEEFDAGETYVSLMRKNLEALREGLL